MAVAMTVAMGVAVAIAVKVVLWGWFLGAQVMWRGARGRSSGVLWAIGQVSAARAWGMAEGTASAADWVK